VTALPRKVGNEGLTLFANFCFTVLTRRGLRVYGELRTEDEVSIAKTPRLRRGVFLSHHQSTLIDEMANALDGVREVGSVDGEVQRLAVNGLHVEFALDNDEFGS